MSSSAVCQTQVLLHEGVVTRGRAKALQRLRSIRELQVALGVSQVAVESLELQKLEVNVVPRACLF